MLPRQEYGRSSPPRRAASSTVSSAWTGIFVLIPSAMIRGMECCTPPLRRAHAGE